MTVQEIAEQIDDAIAKRDKAKAEVDVLEKSLSYANNAYSEAVNEVSSLHKTYLAKMQDIMSYGGTKHVG